MTLLEIDRTLARLRSAAELISANLLELEHDPHLKLLEPTSLSGRSAAEWAEARMALADLWQWFTRFNAMLEEATEARGRKARLTPVQEASLEGLLNGPSITLATTAVPLGERGLLGRAASTTQCTPDELLDLMSAAFDRAKSVVLSIGHVWDTLLPRLRAAEADLEGLAQPGRSLGQDHAAPLRARLARLAEALARDPLSVAGGDVADVEAEVGAVRRELESATRLQRELDGRFGQARALLDEVLEAADAAAEAHRRVQERIVLSPAPPAPPVEASLAQQLDRAESFAGEGDWVAAQRELAEWTARARGLLARLRENEAASRAPIEERNQLRGRLDAYQAKVHRLGLIENPALSALYDHARAVLYTAPTDLGEAAELVRRYQQAMPGERPRKEPM